MHSGSLSTVRSGKTDYSHPVSLLDYHSTSLCFCLWVLPASKGLLNHKRYGKPCQGTIMCTSIYISMPNKISVCSMCHLGFSLPYYFCLEYMKTLRTVHCGARTAWNTIPLQLAFRKLEKCFAWWPLHNSLAVLGQLLGKAPTIGGKISSGVLSFSEESVWCHWWQTQGSCVCLLSEASAFLLTGYCSYFFSFSRNCACP